MRLVVTAMCRVSGLATGSELHGFRALQDVQGVKDLIRIELDSQFIRFLNASHGTKRGRSLFLFNLPTGKPR
ncbi:hypothetical protein BDZ91DRAFT_526097 [Kalaharituber pfeilii]|nr:hypothetical protein BDZ91DRAFT_526097 [Kalaharituber pfeilii]